MFVTLINHGVNTFSISKEDRICQLLIERCVEILLVEAELSGSTRGEGCLGSTGTNLMDLVESTSNEQNTELNTSFFSMLYN